MTNEIQLKITLDGKQAQTAAKAISDAVNGISNSAKETTSRFADLGQRMMGINQGVEVISRLRDLISAPISKAAAFETASVQMRVLLGSAGAAEDRMKELVNFANTTPFELPQVVKASKILQTFGGTALATGDSLRMVGDMASSSGAQFDEIAMWVGRAYTAIQSGKPFGEAAMRLQELALLSGESRDKIEQLQKSGAKSTEVWKAFQNEMAKFNGMMTEQANTFEGKVSTMNDAIDSFERSAVQTFFPALTKGVEVITSLSNSLNNLPNAAKVGAGGIAVMATAFVLLNSSMGATPYVILGLGTTFGALYTAIKDGDPVLTVLAGTFVALSATVYALGTKGIVLLISNMLGLNMSFIAGTANTATFAGAVQSLNLSLGMTALLVGGIVVAAAAIGTVAYLLWTNAEKEQEKHLARMTENASKISRDLIESINAMPAGKIKIEFVVGEIEASKQRTKNLIAELNRLLDEGGDNKARIAEIEISLNAEQTLFDRLLKEKTKASKEAQAKQVEDKTVYNSEMLALEKIRAENLTDGVEKELALEEVKHIELLAKYKKEFTDKNLRNKAIEEEERRHKEEMEKIVPEQKFTGKMGVNSYVSGEQIGALAGDGKPIVRKPSMMQSLFDSEDADDKSLQTIAGREKKIAGLQTQLASEASASKRNELRRQIADHQNALDKMTGANREYSKGAIIVSESITAGFSQAWSQSIMTHRQAKNKGDAIWLAMQQTAVSTIGSMLAEQLRSWVLEGIGYTALSTTKAVTKTAETGIIVANDATQATSAVATAGVVAGANAVEGGTSLLAAVANGIKSVMALPFPINLIAGAGITASIYALYRGAKSILQFAEGGIFEGSGKVVGEGGPKDDRINAKLSNGEFVTNAEATGKNLPILEEANKKKISILDTGIVRKFITNVTTNTPMKNFSTGGQYATQAELRLPTVEMKQFSAPNYGRLTIPEIKSGNSKQDLSFLSKKLDDVVSAISKLNVIANIDGEKLTARVERQQRINLSKVY